MSFDIICRLDLGQNARVLAHHLATIADARIRYSGAQIVAKGPYKLGLIAITFNTVA